MVLSSPSGVGKTTLSRMLCADDPLVDMSVSVTTRPPRPVERHGEDYEFIDDACFKRLRDQGELLEWAHVFDFFYGTRREPVERSLQQGRDVLFDIDWQGTQQLHEKSGQDLVRVFILPPSIAILRQRLRTRGQDSDDVLMARMMKASDEISHWAEYDYVIVNKDIAASLSSIKSILFAERLRRARGVGLSDFVRRLQADL